MALGEAHADLDGRAATQVRRAYMEKSPLTVPMLREMRTLIKAAFHPSVSGMSREQIIRYVYMTAKHLGWSWSELEGRAIRQNQPRGCRGSAAPGRSGEAPLRALGTAPKRKPSAYNLFIRDHMADNPDGDARERFSDAVDAWKAGQGRRSGAKQAAATRATRRELRDDYERAQAKRKSARITTAVTQTTTILCSTAASHCQSAHLHYRPIAVTTSDGIQPAMCRCVLWGPSVPGLSVDPPLVCPVLPVCDTGHLAKCPVSQTASAF